jgi:hypothetical protein
MGDHQRNQPPSTEASHTPPQPLSRKKTAKPQANSATTRNRSLVTRQSAWTTAYLDLCPFQSDGLASSLGFSRGGEGQTVQPANYGLQSYKTHVLHMHPQQVLCLCDRALGSCLCGRALGSCLCDRALVSCIRGRALASCLTGRVPASSLSGRAPRRSGWPPQPYGTGLSPTGLVYQLGGDAQEVRAFTMHG